MYMYNHYVCSLNKNERDFSICAFTFRQTVCLPTTEYYTLCKDIINCSACGAWRNFILTAFSFLVLVKFIFSVLSLFFFYYRGLNLIYDRKM